jgi:hypothetical protein
MLAVLVPADYDTLKKLLDIRSFVPSDISDELKSSVEWLDSTISSCTSILFSDTAQEHIIEPPEN